MKVKPTAKPGRVVMEVGREDEQLLEEALALPFKVKTIMVPTDFSDFALKAPRYAAGLAEKLDSKVILIHVVEPRLYPYNSKIEDGEMQELGLTWQEVSRDKLESLRWQEIDPRRAVNLVVAIGVPFMEIVKVAKSTGTDLIVIATHGYTGLQHTLLGSTAERVVQHASCLVLVVRGEEEIAHRKCINKAKSDATGNRTAG